MSLSSYPNIAVAKLFRFSDEWWNIFNHWLWSFLKQSLMLKRFGAFSYANIISSNITTNFVLIDREGSPTELSRYIHRYVKGRYIQVHRKRLVSAASFVGLNKIKLELTIFLGWRLTIWRLRFSKPIRIENFGENLHLQIANPSKKLFWLPPFNIRCKM